MNSIANWLNRWLVRRGFLLVPVPPSSKMLHEHANVSVSHHPSRGGNTVRWMRTVADQLAEAKFHRRAAVIRDWRCRCGKTLGQDGGGCEWHPTVRARALAGEVTEEQCR